ncbi:MAG TPA: L-seryl-tRNA(Sec) selenium transferase [Chloroflexota bacterium]|jgi:L-seryl-tRNA(Ser) seleniumtransferase|nr:L-seryl-tRNA(Sec) selenium transferase [Chloroflexota bacterium]
MSGDGLGLRSLPSVDRLLAHPEVAALAGSHARPIVLEAARRALAAAREAARTLGQAPSLDRLAAALADEVRRAERPSLRPLINGTGVIIQTNLGRAPVSGEAAGAMSAIATGYSNLEYDLEQGERGSRTVHLEGLLRQVSGAEAGLAVNNNASAVLLALAALARGREVVIARGQLVEIGGGFRVPDVMLQSGARLVEVGTTNRTYVQDYADAIGPETAVLLRVHASNFRVVGFTHEVGLAELAKLAGERGLLVVDDLGSGSLLDTSVYGLAHEPMVGESVAAGAEVVCFSGDKLLGGPQAGILVGKKDAIDRLKRHPLARAVRLDKASIGGLEATLRHYARGEATQAIPVWRMIATPLDRIAARAEGWRGALAAAGIDAEVVASESAVGGGSLPGETLPTRALAVTPGDSAEALARRLRRADPPLVARIERDRVLVDPRTVLPEWDTAVRDHLLQFAQS